MGGFVCFEAQLNPHNTVSRDPNFTCWHMKSQMTKGPVRHASSSLALRILSPLFMSAQVGPWEQAERGAVSIRNTGCHNELCLQLHCWQTPAQRSWKGVPLRSHTHRRMSQCAATRSSVCTVYTAFVRRLCSPTNGDRSADENQKEGTSLWVPAGVHVH